MVDGISEKITVRATCPGKRDFTQPLESTAIERPSSQAVELPEIHGREVLKTSTKGYSVDQSTGPVRFVPRAERSFAAVYSGSTGSNLKIGLVIKEETVHSPLELNPKTME